MNIKLLLNYFFIGLVLLGCNANSTSSENDQSTPTNNIEGCMEISACNFDPNATTNNVNSCIFETDACGVCGGSANSNTSCSKLLNIILNNSIPISGFQFDIRGVNITSSYGGSAEAAGFSVSSSSSRVLGFSFSGASLSPGEKILTILEVVGNIQDACLENVILSNVSGASPDFIIEDCTKIIVP